MSTAVSIPPSSGLLTREQAAEYLSVAPQTLAVWATTGRYDLRYIKVGRFARYRRADLEAFLQSRTVGARPSSTQQKTPVGFAPFDRGKRIYLEWIVPQAATKSLSPGVPPHPASRPCRNPASPRLAGGPRRRGGNPGAGRARGARQACRCGRLLFRPRRSGTSGGGPRRAEAGGRLHGR